MAGYSGPVVANGPTSFPSYQQEGNLNLNWDQPSSRIFEVDPGFMWYNPQGRNTTELFEAQHKIAATYFPQSLQYPRQYYAKTEAAGRLMESAVSGDRIGMAVFKEALSFDEFQYIMQDTLYRRMLAKWAIPRSPFKEFSHEVKVPTMYRPGKMFTLDGIETPLPLVNPGEQPTIRYPYDSGIAVRPYKYMADVEILWETILEDDLNALGDIPNRLNNAIQITMGRIFTKTYADSAGWKDSADSDPFYVTNNDKIRNPTLSSTSAAGIANVLVANTQQGTPAHAPLSPASIRAARSQMAKFLSPDGNPIDISLIHLVVPAGLQEVAATIQATTRILQERGGGLRDDGTSGLMRLEVNSNPLSGIKVHVDPYLHTVVTDTAIQDSMWMLLADKDIARPLFCHCVLAGHETPVVMRRLPNYQSIGGGPGRNLMDMQSTGFRCGLIIGTQWGDPRGAIVSLGNG